jgi:hypothetical protein
VPIPEFRYEDLLPTGPGVTAYRLLTTEGVRSVAGPGGREFLPMCVDFPAFIVVDDKGNDFFADVTKPMAMSIPLRAGL